MMMIDFENRKHMKFQLNSSISFRDISFQVNFNIGYKFQNVLCALGFEVKHLKFSVEVLGHV